MGGVDFGDELGAGLVKGGRLNGSVGTSAFGGLPRGRTMAGRGGVEAWFEEAAVSVAIGRRGGGYRYRLGRWSTSIDEHKVSLVLLGKRGAVGGDLARGSLP